MNDLRILLCEGGDAVLAKEYAEKLNTQIVTSLENEDLDTLFLELSDIGVSLRKGKLSMQGDFSKMMSRVLPGKLQHEKLAKAAKVTGVGEYPTAIDATAGMGEDALIIAAAGYHVTLFEKDPVISILLQDTLRRARDIPELLPIVNRMEVVEGDSLEAMKEMSERGEYPDLIYLDPMFPARSKSGLIKKKFQLLQQLESPATDGEDMLAIAIAAKPRKIVIKRPQKGELLGGRKPSYSIPGKAIRYDCLLFPRD